MSIVYKDPLCYDVHSLYTNTTFTICSRFAKPLEPEDIASAVVHALSTSPQMELK